MERIRRAYPDFFGGAAATQIVAALAKHGSLTPLELAAVLGWRSRTTVHHRVRRLLKIGVIVKYPQFRSSRPPLTRKVIFALDYRHPWHSQIRTLGRALARGFPLPHPEVLEYREKRPYFGPRSPMHPMPTQSVFDWVSDRVSHRVLMLLAHVDCRSKGVPITKLAKLVGASRYGLLEAIRCLEQWGIVRSTYVKLERRVQLNPKFCAYDALRKICRLMDRDTDREFYGLAMARMSQLTRDQWREWHRKRRKREASNLAQREAYRRRHGI
jgi:DNA-binding Lrp family transcriptional regulator